MKDCVNTFIIFPVTYIDLRYSFVLLSPDIFFFSLEKKYMYLVGLAVIHN
jgi:hypothetical protein